MIAQPPAFKGGDDIDKIVYSLNNSWYIGLYYDKASKSLFRLARIGQNINKSDIPEANSGVPVPGANKYQTFKIDPETGEYSVIPDMNLYNARFFHPQYGTYQIYQINEELGLDPEDYVVFTPMMKD